MKGKKINEISPIEGILSTISSMAHPENNDRSDVFRDEFGDIIVDTVSPCDIKVWETGINRNGDWIIVEQYEDRESAKEGHKKWVNLLKENSNVELEDINVWGEI